MGAFAGPIGAAGLLSSRFGWSGIFPVVGVVILATIMSVPFAGWLVKLTVVLFGLGALWILGREQFGKKEEVV